MKSGRYLVADTTFTPRCPHCDIQIGRATKDRALATAVIKAHLDLHRNLGRVGLSITTKAMYP